MENRTKIGLALVAMFAFAFVPVGNATLLTYLVQLLGGTITVNPAFQPTANLTSTSVVASQPAVVSGSFINNLAATSRQMKVIVTPAAGTLSFGASGDITDMNLTVNGVTRQFIPGECIGGATLNCTTSSGVSLANGTNNVNVSLTPNTLFDPAQSPLSVSYEIQ